MPRASSSKRPQCRLVPLKIPYPDPLYPKMYQAYNHPLNPSPDGRTFVFLIDTSKKAMTLAYWFEKALKIPKGSAKEVIALGKCLLIID